MSSKSAQAIFEIARVEAQYAYNAAMREAYSVLQAVKGVNDDIYLATMMTARAQFEAAVSDATQRAYRALAKATEPEPES